MFSPMSLDVKSPFDRYGATGGHFHAQFTEVHEAVAWQWLEMRLLFRQSPSAALIELIDDPFKKAAIGNHTFEIRRSS